MPHRTALVALGALLLVSATPRPQRPRPQQDTRGSAPHWLWLGEPGDGQQLFFRRTIRLATAPKRAVLVGACDNVAHVWINGKPAGESREWQTPFCFDVAPLLRRGENVIAIRARNESGPAGLCARFDTGGVTIATDASWRVSKRQARGWRRPGFDDSGWDAPDVLARLGAGAWSVVGERAFRQAEVRAPDGAQVTATARRADGLSHPGGFAVDELLTVPKRLGSWVALARAPGNTLFAAGERGGLFRIRPAAIGDAASRTSVKKLDVSLPGMHGLLYSRDRLYVVCNGKSGLYALRDTTGDGEFDQKKLLREFRGAGEHGPHSLIEDSGGTHLILVAGNHTSLPELAHSRVPRRWHEDLLLPRIWDPRGHARGRMAPGGWIARLDREGKDLELITCGLRNSFDVAMAFDGELFTYDADMEWDMGMPWYRPTRILHCVSGADFGWRAGSGKWADYFEDSLPAAVDIGPGSPTGLLFGTGTSFPPRYEQALFALDWTFGTIWAVHLEPRNSTYGGTKEPFVTGKPLPLCDAVVGDDGAMYFVTGGRGLQSKLYRIRYGGDAPRTPVAEDPCVEARRERREIEAMHGRGAERDLDRIFARLGDADRFAGHAARVALEHVPVGQWAERALAIPGEPRHARAKIRAMIGLARCGPESMRARALAALTSLPFEKLDADLQLAMIRALGLIELRLGPLHGNERRELGARLLPVYRSTGDRRVARELCRLLARFGLDGFVEVTLTRMEDAPNADLPRWPTLISRNSQYGSPIRRMLQRPPPTEGLFYANALRRQTGFTQSQHKRYFAFLNRARSFPGGASYSSFIEHFRREAMERLTGQRRKELQPVLLAWFQSTPDVKVTPPRGPGRDWTLAEATRLVAEPLRGRSHSAGKNLFRAAQCFRCHRFDGEGGAVGPDLSSVAQRLRPEELVEAVIDPNLAVSDQYVATRVVTKGDAVHEGLVVDKSKGKPDGWLEIWPIQADEEPLRLRNRDVKSRELLKISPMPPDLFDPLNGEEIKDLIAYMLSGGDPQHEAFTK